MNYTTWKEKVAEILNNKFGADLNGLDIQQADLEISYDMQDTPEEACDDYADIFGLTT